MNRVQKLKLNTSTSLLYRIVSIISGFILPRLILVYYGSDINGLIASITQFLSIITFLDLGIGGVVQSVLYYPISIKDNQQISLILSSAQKHFNRIAYILIAYTLLLIFIVPLIIQDLPLSFLSIGLLIFAMSIRTFSQFYFGIVNELLLNADQRSYIHISAEIVVVIINLLVGSFLIVNGYSLHIVYLIASLIFLTRPLYLRYYVSKHYDINYNLKINKEPIEQKWNGMAQHIAYTIQNSIDIVILSIFSTLENVSIYSVYNLVILGIKSIIHSLIVGLQSFFGNMLAHNEIKLLNYSFDKIEWGLHTIVIFLFGLTAVLINPFVSLYTTGVDDVNYFSPIFSFLLVISGAIYCFQIPYQIVVFAAGHYKETQTSSIIETVINIIISFLLVFQYGLVGVVIGTLFSTLYRVVYLTYYLSKKILNRPIQKFIKQIIIDIFTFLIMLTVASSFSFLMATIIDWIKVSLIFGVLFAVIILIINHIFYKENLYFFIRRFFNRTS